MLFKTQNTVERLSVRFLQCICVAWEGPSPPRTQFLTNKFVSTFLCHLVHLFVNACVLGLLAFLTIRLEAMLAQNTQKVHNIQFHQGD